MKKIITLALVSIFATAVATAQHNHGNCGNCPHHQQHQQQSGCQSQQTQTDGIDMSVVKAFPTAKSVKKDKKWTEVYDANNKLLGYALYSKPASDGIKGYNGETPLMIALSPKEKVMSVILLDNQETPSFIARVMEAGLLKSWDGLKVKKAAKKKVDTVSGATYSSRSIIQTLQAALKNM